MATEAEIAVMAQRAIEFARAYAANPGNRDRLYPPTLSDAERQAIERKISEGYGPYQTQVKAVIAATGISFATAGGTTTYLAGANGSKQLLMEFARNNPEIAATLQGSAYFDFQAAKDAFTAQAGVSLEGNGYYPFRPLFSGMDRAVQEQARANGLNLVVDNVVPPQNTPTQDTASSRNTRILAVALTPAQSAARAENLGMNPAEARGNAQRFADYFQSIRSQGPDITLFNETGEVLFERKNGTVTRNDELAVASWLAQSQSFVSEYPPRGPVPPLPAQSLGR